MRARALVDTLAPGVKARDTAERETPARLATSAAVTNARRADSWPNSNSGFAHVCIILRPGCTRVQARPNIRGNDIVGTTRRDDNCLNLRGIGCRRGARGCAVACPRRSERDRATISAARWSLKSLRSCLAPRCARGSHRGQSQPLAPHKVRRGSVKPDIFLLRARLELIPVELLARTPRMRMECFSSTVDSVPDPRPRGDLR